MNLLEQHLNRLSERCGYLSDRVEIKKKRGWEYQHDQEERDALAWALEQLRRDPVTVNILLDGNGKVLSEAATRQ